MITKNLSFMTRLLTDNPKPEVVSVNLTQACNQRCKYCEIGNGKVKQEKPLLKKTDLIWIIEEMEKNDIPLLSIGGGEPLLVPWLWEVLDFANNHGIKTEVITNGMRIPELTEQQINSLRSTYNVSVSIDSMNPEHEDYIRGVNGALTKQFESVRRLHQEKIPFSIATVLSNVNFMDIEELVTTMNTYGARFIKFQPVWGGTNFPGTEGIIKHSLIIKKENIPDIIYVLKNVREYESTHTIKTNAGELLNWLASYLGKTDTRPFYRNFVNRYWCHSLHSIITINYYGEILPCNYLPARVNINGVEPFSGIPRSLVDMWNAACYDARELLNKGDHAPECVLCTHSLEMGVICSGIRHPLSNINVLPRLGKMTFQKIRKQKAMSKGKP
jgi:MoaA/NifB/PqqE/SkfB family radical SAM enzyme